jgi:UPF0042 nucleotide-binding protein
VYIAEWLGARFRDEIRVLVRHRSAARRIVDQGAAAASGK